MTRLEVLEQASKKASAVGSYNEFVKQSKPMTQAPVMRQHLACFMRGGPHMRRECPSLWEPAGKTDCSGKRMAFGHALLNDNVVVGQKANHQVGISNRKANQPTQNLVSWPIFRSESMIGMQIIQS